MALPATVLLFCLPGRRAPSPLDGDWGQIFACRHAQSDALVVPQVSLKSVNWISQPSQKLPYNLQLHQAPKKKQDWRTQKASPSGLLSDLFCDPDLPAKRPPYFLVLQPLVEKHGSECWDHRQGDPLRRPILRFMSWKGLVPHCLPDFVF